MSAKITRIECARFLFGLALALIGAWTLEAWMVGRGTVSVYLAPIGLILMAISVFLADKPKKA